MAVIDLKSLFSATRAPIDPAQGERLEHMLAPTLAELEATRADVVRKVDARMMWCVPLGLAAGVALNIIKNHGHANALLLDGMLYAVGGMLGGWAWAQASLSNRYRRLYKQRVLPQLAALFGKLDYRPAAIPDLGFLRAQGLFEAFDKSEAEDEIFGTYRGLPLSMIELELTRKSGDDERTVFDGLLTRLDLPRALVGTTAVIASAGLLGSLRGFFAGRERVHVEDPRFEATYTVYGTDQIAARALLTPAFMERFLALGERAGFGRPLALAQDNRLTIALPRSGGANLFEPPGYRQPAASAAALAKLYDDIAAVLKAADAVIDLDQGSRAVAANAKPARA